MPRALFKDIRRSARRGKCSFRIGDFYVGQEMLPCDASGHTIRGIWHKLQSAQWARAQAVKARDAESRARWIAGAKEILAMQHVVAHEYWRGRFE
jgi:hypothetical protein